MALCRIPFLVSAGFYLLVCGSFLLFAEDAENIFGIAKP